MSLLSIIIPVYNAEKTVGRMLESLNRIAPDTREAVEVVLVDDGCTDKSMEIIKSKNSLLSTFKMDILQHKNIGTSGARNAGLDKCTGKWVFFLDADDELIFDPTRYIKESPGFTALGFSVKFKRNLKQTGKRRASLVTKRNHLDVFTSGNALTISGIVFIRDRLTTPFDTECKLLEDWLFWIKNPLVFENMKLFPHVFSVIIHSHGDNRSSNYLLSGRYREHIALRVIKENGFCLTKRQRNNLFIQSRIGAIQQGGKAGLTAFFKFPCDIKLYFKLIAYFVLRGNFAKFDFYGQ